MTKKRVADLGRRGIREAGSRERVAKVLGRSPSSVSYDSTTRTNPEVARFYREVLVPLAESPTTTARALAYATVAVVDAIEWHDQPTATLVDRALYLMDRLPTYRQAVQDAAISGDDQAHAEAHEKYGTASTELGGIAHVLRARGVSLLEYYRRRKAS
ncbi:MAG: hypothetical protein AAF389_14995 [Gemmatimonadota bacterium]